MKTLFDLEKTAVAAVAKRGLLLTLIVTLYIAGLSLISHLSGSAFLVMLAALYFIPAVFRGWLDFYWLVVEEISALRAHFKPLKS